MITPVSDRQPGRWALNQSRNTKYRCLHALSIIMRKASSDDNLRRNLLALNQ